MNIDAHEVELLFSALMTIAGFFIAFWIKGVRDDVHEAVKEINSLGNRATALETEIRTLVLEVDGLRKERRDLGNKVAELLLRIKGAA
jgi:uncharacterized coiled-coil DUF342 family protein